MKKEVHSTKQCYQVASPRSVGLCNYYDTPILECESLGGGAESEGGHLFVAKVLNLHKSFRLRVTNGRWETGIGATIVIIQP